MKHKKGEERETMDLFELLPQENERKPPLYYPLHVHLAFGSIGDSILRTRDYVKRAKEYGLDSLAVTDHGSLSAIYDFARECKKEGIKPIYGMEAYEAEDMAQKDKEHRGYSHLILLARTLEGFHNLIRIHNIAQTDGFYYKPRIDRSVLRKYGRGLIASSACIQGSIPQAILDEDPEHSVSLIQEYKSIFDSFYLEVQPGHFEEQLKVNDAIVELARYTDTPILVTNDIHYLNHEDYMPHNFHVALKRKQVWKQGDPLLYPDTCYWFMSYEDIRTSFVQTELVTQEVVEEGIENAARIVRECNVDVPLEVHMPKFTQLPAGVTEEQELYRRCYAALNKLKEHIEDPVRYEERLERELNVISQKGFCGYFLIVQEYVDWARKNDIPVGPGRGSAAGSLVLYLLGICQADPIRYDLMFERFLDPHREAIPDVDVDFMTGARDRLFEHAIDVYGQDHCALVSTFGIRKAKSAVRDVARVLNYNKEVGDAIAKLIPTVYYGDDGEKTTDLAIEDALKVVPELQEYQKQYPDLFDIAMKIEGLPRSTGLHAAGMLISPESFNETLPLIRSGKEGVLATSLNLDDAELSYVKFDFLALSFLETMANTQRDANWHFDYHDEALFHDDAVWDIIGSRNTTGIFQLGSKTYKDRMPRLKPRSIDELAACLALIRGPAISSKMDEVYMEILEGKKEIQHLHPLYDAITADTNGVLLYQEQVMKLAVAFGMNLTTGYRIVKDGAKKRVDKLRQYRTRFVQNALERDCDEQTANQIFDLIEKSSLYLFNRSHAVSYAMVSYVCAYLKVHYPLLYMKNLLTSIFARGTEKEYDQTVEECRRLGIQFLPADINLSHWGFSIEGDKIRVGLCAVKGFGEKAGEFITGMTEGGFLAADIRELKDAIQQQEMGRIFNKKVMTVSCFSGLFDRMMEEEGFDSRLDYYEAYIAGEKDEPLKELKIGKLTIDPQNTTREELERAYFNLNFIYDPANELPSFGWQDIKAKDTFETKVLVDRVKKIKTKNGDPMAFLTLKSGDGILDCTVFPGLYENVKKNLKKGSFLNITAQKEDEERCILRSIQDAS